MRERFYGEVFIETRCRKEPNEKQGKQWIMKHLREKVICVIREFDFTGDGEKICPYHNPLDCLTESIIMCVYILGCNSHSRQSSPGEGGEHLISPKLVFITIHGKISFVMNLLFSAW